MSVKANPKGARMKILSYLICEMAKIGVILALGSKCFLITDFYFSPMAFVGEYSS
jgi:hypothetical protein